uniref:Uncharacterized protein n=1 Tax=Lotus japonicus TaxID=34305 RepID=I3S110_LOTJA|nr:unknown [Lotus japonicus]
MPSVTYMKQVHPLSDEVLLQMNWVSCSSYSKDSCLILSAQNNCQMSPMMLAESGFLPSSLGSLH